MILLDDDDDLRELLQLALEHRGFRVKAFGEAAAAIEFIETSASDVVGLVADVILPDQDGYAVCKKLAASNPSARIIVVSGDARQIRAPDSERFKTLLKPVSIETLCRELKAP